MMRAVLLLLVLAVPIALCGAARAVDERTAIEQLLERLPVDKRAEVEAAIDRLPPRQRELVLKRYEELDPDQRALIERSATGQPAEDPYEAHLKRQAQNAERWAALSESEREALRQQLRDFQALSAEEQEALIEGHFARRTPDRRREVLNRLRNVPMLR